MFFWVWVVALGACLSWASPVENEDDLIALIKNGKLFPSLYSYRRSGFPILPRTPVKVSTNLGGPPEFHLVYRKDHISQLRYEYTPVGTVYSKNLLDALDGKSWHTIAESRSATRFMLWEMTYYPSLAALYDLMASKPAFTSQVLISENFEIYKFIPDILAKAALENLDLFQRISTYGRLINVKDRFGQPINSAHVMRLTQWLQIVHDSIDKVHKEHAHLGLSASEWDDGMSTALCRTAEINGDRVAARLLADPNIMRIFSKKKIGEFVKIVNGLGVSERILTSMLRSHVVKKVPGYTWARTLAHFLEQRMDAQSLRILESEIVMKQISLDYFKALVEQILAMPYLNEDLVDALGYKFNAQRLSGEEWGATILQIAKARRESLLETLLQMDFIVESVPDELLEQILTTFLENLVPSPQVVYNIVKGTAIKKMSFDFSTRFLKGLINKVNSNGAELMLTDEKYINSLPDESFRVVAQALVRRRYMWTARLLEVVLSKHVVSRMLDSEIGPILIKLYLTDRHQMAQDILEKAHDKVPGLVGARILKDLSESPSPDYAMLSALVEVRTISGEHWVEALELFYGKKDVGSVDIILSQQHISQALEPEIRVGVLETLTRDEVFREGLSPIILEDAQKSTLDLLFKTDGRKPVPRFPRLDVQSRLRTTARQLRLPPVRRILGAANLRVLPV